MSRLDWSWMKAHMPRVVAALGEARRKGGGAVIDECWRKGVIQQQPGWFFARENGVSVGVPSVELLQDPTLAELQRLFPNSALLHLKGEPVSVPDLGAESVGPPLPHTRHYNATQRRTQEAYGKD